MPPLPAPPQAIRLSLAQEAYIKILPLIIAHCCASPAGARPPCITPG